MKKLAKAVNYREEDQMFEVNYWDGSCAEISLQDAHDNAIIVKEDKTGEEWLKYRMTEGWNIIIEAKGKGRIYEMTYEATANKLDLDWQENLKSQKHAVGNTLWELMHNLFDDKIGEINEETSK